MENDLVRVVDAVFDALPGLVWTARPDGCVDFFNRRWCEYTGLDVDHVLGHGWQTATHPEDLPGLLERWRSILASGGPGEMEARLRRFDGVYRWFLLRLSPLPDSSGHLVKWCGINIDIEERKRAEVLLAGEKRLLEMVAGGRPMPVILEAFCQLVESTASGRCCSVVLVDPCGTRFEQGASPSLPASFITSIVGRRVDLDSSPCAMATHLNKQVITADIGSETRWAAYAWSPMALAIGLRACWSTPICATTGKVLGAFAIYCDVPRIPTSNDQSLIEQITHIASVAIERTQSDAMLKRSEAFLSATRRLSSFGGFSKRVATGEITWSAEVYRIFELDPAEPVTLERILTRVHPEDSPSFQAMLDRQQRGSDYEHEYRLLMPDQSVKYLHVVAHATRDQDGQLEYLATVQDVTQRRLSEEALAKARSELARVARVTTLGALTASIAHEVNQPLSGIITNASTCLRMLASDPPNVDGARDTARRTIRDGNRASDVIKRLRALFAKQDATTEPVDLNEATREVIALLRSELQRNRVVLQTELVDDLPTITGDRIQLQQVILNLLLNASEAMSGVDDRPRSLVTRTGRDEGDRVLLSVRDAGLGIEPQGAERLFDAFYTTKSGGMGIGLSVSRSIVESHHGKLWATPNDGPGTTFTFSIPRRPEGVKGAHSRGANWTAAVTDTQPVMRNP
jgi:PAS domain S-box-containing protein